SATSHTVRPATAAIAAIDSVATGWSKTLWYGRHGMPDRAASSASATSRPGTNMTKPSATTPTTTNGDRVEAEATRWSSGTTARAVTIDPTTRASPIVLAGICAGCTRRMAEETRGST